MSNRKLLALVLAIPLTLGAALAQKPEDPDHSKDPRAQRLLEREKETGNFGPVSAVAIPSTPRYLVTYMNSQTGGRTRSATVVSVTNQSQIFNRVFVAFFKGLTNNSTPVCVAAFAVPPDFTIDFCSRQLPNAITTCNSTCGGPGTINGAELNFDEGRAVASSMWPEIGVSSRVVYTSGDQDESVSAITDSNVVVFGKGNRGD